MNEGIERTIARASELETLVHSEVNALERSYADNEMRMRSLVESLGSERDAIVGHAERVRASISGAHEQLKDQLALAGDDIAQAHRDLRPGLRLHDGDARGRSRGNDERPVAVDGGRPAAPDGDAAPVAVGFGRHAELHLRYALRQPDDPVHQARRGAAGGIRDARLVPGRQHREAERRAEPPRPPAQRNADRPHARDQREPVRRPAGHHRRSRRRPCDHERGARRQGRAVPPEPQDERRRHRHRPRPALRLLRGAHGGFRAQRDLDLRRARRRTRPPPSTSAPAAWTPSSRRAWRGSTRAFRAARAPSTASCRQAWSASAARSASRAGAISGALEAGHKTLSESLETGSQRFETSLRDHAASISGSLQQGHQAIASTVDACRGSSTDTLARHAGEHVGIVSGGARIPVADARERQPALRDEPARPCRVDFRQSPAGPRGHCLDRRCRPGTAAGYPRAARQRHVDLAARRSQRPRGDARRQVGGDRPAARRQPQPHRPRAVRALQRALRLDRADREAAQRRRSARRPPPSPPSSRAGIGRSRTPSPAMRTPSRRP